MWRVFVLVGAKDVCVYERARDVCVPRNHFFFSNDQMDNSSNKNQRK